MLPRKSKFLLQGDRSSYEKMFPHTFMATGSTVDMLDQSWRRAARDHWPILFKHYNIIVTARYVILSVWTVTEFIETLKLDQEFLLFLSFWFRKITIYITFLPTFIQIRFNWTAHIRLVLEIRKTRFKTFHSILPCVGDRMKCEVVYGWNRYLLTEHHKSASRTFALPTWSYSIFEKENIFYSYR